MPLHVISQKRKVQLVWVMTITLVLLFTVNSLGTCIIAALMGKQWTILPLEEKFLLIVIVIVNWSTMMMAFLNRSISHLLGDVAVPLATDIIPPKQNQESK